MSYWSVSEVRDLLSIWGDAETMKKLQSSRNAHIWNEILVNFSSLGHERTMKQVRDKVCNLKNTYYKEKRKVDKSGETSTCWEFYWDMNEILGRNPLATPKRLLDTSGIGNPDDNSIKIEAESAEIEFDDVKIVSETADPRSPDGVQDDQEEEDTAHSKVVEDQLKQPDDMGKVEGGLESKKSKSNAPPRGRGKRQRDSDSSLTTKIVSEIAKSDEKFYKFEKERFKQEMEFEKERMKLEQERERERNSMFREMFNRILNPPAAPASAGLFPSHFTAGPTFIGSSAPPQFPPNPPIVPMVAPISYPHQQGQEFAGGSRDSTEISSSSSDSGDSGSNLLSL